MKPENGKTHLSEALNKFFKSLPTTTDYCTLYRRDKKLLQIKRLEHATDTS